MRPVRFAATALCTAVTSISIGAAVGALVHTTGTYGIAALFGFGAQGTVPPAALAPVMEALAIVAVSFILSSIAAKLVTRNEVVSLALSGAGAIALAAGYLLGPVRVECFPDDTATTFALGAALMLAVFMLMSLTSAFKGNFDTGAEHGSQRMAKMDEVTSLADTDHFYNNFIWSQNAWQCHIAYNKKLRAAQDRRNLNEIAIGTSGMGKSYHCVIPNLLNALGDSVKPLETGGRRIITNIIEHAKAHRHPDAFSSMRPEDVANDCRISDGKEIWRRAAKEKAGLGSGWDVVHTDPKGDNVRAVGALYEAAGVDMRLFNTVDFDGNCYNPLADEYIKPHWADVRDVNELTCTVTLEAADDTGKPVRKTFPVTSISHTEFAEQPPAVMDVGEARLCAQGQMRYRQRITAADLEGYDFEDLIKQVDEAESETESSAGPGVAVAYLEWETGTLSGVESEGESNARLARLASEREGDSETMKLLRRQTYRKTRSYYSVTVTNFLQSEGSAPADCILHIKLDECQALDRDSIKMSVSNHDVSPVVTADASKLESEGVLSLTIKGVECWGAVRINFEADTVSFRVPDGVQLAKTVECLVANLKHADQPSNNNDPFWDECKRLCFMALCSAAYEMYDRAEDRNLNTVARLLDMASPEVGGWENMTPLAYLMKRWETGKDIPEANETQEDPRDADPFAVTHRPKRASDIDWWRDPDRVPHSRTASLAINCYRAYSVGAEDTVRSVIITCKAAFVSLFTPEIKKMIAKDEMRLTELGEKGRRQAVFVVTKDTNSPYDFLTALLMYQAIDVLLDKAYANGGKLSRHVRFEIDESMTIGKLSILDRALAVVRSRNMSIALYMQAKSQCQELYGEKVADSIFENVSVIKYLGSNGRDTNNDLSEIIGDETIYSRITNRSWSGAVGVAQVSESVQSQARKVRSSADLRQMNRSKLIALVSGMCAIEDEKYHTSEHPYYPYVYSDHPRPLESPVARVTKPFEFADYQARRDAAALKEAAREGKG